MIKTGIQVVAASKPVLVRMFTVINMVLYCSLLVGSIIFFYTAHSPYGSGYVLVHYVTIMMLGTAIVGIAVNVGLARYSAIAYYLSMIGWTIEIIVLAAYLYFNGMSTTWTPWGWYDYAWVVPIILVVYRLISIIYFRTKPVRTSFDVN